MFTDRENRQLQKGLYTVICGYEFDPKSMLEPEVTFCGSVIAADIEFNSAAHIVRTLNEQGEADMSYWMLPAILHSALVIDVRKG